MRLWYLRRAVPWAALLGCLTIAVVVTLLVRQWSEVALIGLPLVVVSCGAAAGFAFDEPATAIASVSPRAGWWRGSTRLLATVPALVAALVLLAAMPAGLHPDRAGWWLVGTALVLFATAPAAWAASSQVGRPGGAVAGATVLLGIAPVVLSMLLGWDTIYPFGDFPAWVEAFWAVVALLCAVGCATAVASLGRVVPLRVRPGAR